MCKVYSLTPKNMIANFRTSSEIIDHCKRNHKSLVKIYKKNDGTMLYKVSQFYDWVTAVNLATSEVIQGYVDEFLDNPV